MIDRIHTFKHKMNQVKSLGRSCCMDDSLVVDDEGCDSGWQYIRQKGRNRLHI